MELLELPTFSLLPSPAREGMPGRYDSKNMFVCAVTNGVDKKKHMYHWPRRFRRYFYMGVRMDGRDCIGIGIWQHWLRTEKIWSSHFACLHACVLCMECVHYFLYLFILFRFGESRVYLFSFTFLNTCYVTCRMAGKRGEGACT